MNEEFLEAFKGAVSSIQRNERFTDGFKSFSIASFLIIDLCNIFEEGTERKITKENIYEDKGIFNFIKAIIPLLKMKDICSSINDELIKKILEDVYLMGGCKDDD